MGFYQSMRHPGVTEVRASVRRDTGSSAVKGTIRCRRRICASPLPS